MFAELRKKRVLSTHAPILSKEVTVFLGLYNAEIFLPSLLHQLESQEYKDFLLIIVDNNSTDSTWSSIQQWPIILDCEVLLVKNPQNLGSSGSINFNFDLVVSEWITFIHQDDFYFPNHLQTLVNEIKKSTNKTVSISTSMGSMDNTGIHTPSKFRAGWLLQHESRETIFLANLRTHCVPWPSTIFRTSNYEAVLSSWHSTSFSDTEMILKLVCAGEVIFVPTETMRYRENPLSESHSVNILESRTISATSLARVFASEDFMRFAESVQGDLRQKFLEGVISGIEIRLGKGAITTLIQLIALESMNFAWRYSQVLNLKILEGIFTALQSSFSENLFSDLAKNVSGGNGEKSLEIPLVGITHLKKELDRVNLNKPRESLILSKIKALDGILSKLFPKKIRRLIMVCAMKIRFKIDPTHPWNFTWRK
jgi:hypothetical protein